jgi:hypothetical protein
MPGNPVRCPKCGAANDCIRQTARSESRDSAYRDPNELPDYAPPASEVNTPLWIFGWLFIIAGVVVLIFAFNFDVSISTDAIGDFSIPSRVANADRMAVREMICMIGCTSFIVGTCFFALAPIHKALLLQLEKIRNPNSSEAAV